MTYNNLPGIHTLLRDGGLVIDRPGAQTQSVLIIACTGTALTGEDTQECKPVWVSNEAAWERQGFGSASIKNIAYTAWREAINTGCQDVRVLTVYGNNGADKYENLHKVYKGLEDYDVDIIALTGVYADDDVGSPTFNQDYDQVDYCSVGANEVDVVGETPDGDIDGTNTVFTLAHTLIVPGSVVLTKTTGGTSVTLVEVNNLTDASANAYKVNYIDGSIEVKTAPTDDPEQSLTVSYAYYDATRSFAAQLNGFLNIVSQRTSQTLGVIALKPSDDNDLLTVRDYVANLPTQIYSGLLQVVGGPECIAKDNSGNAYATSGVASYAGLISTLSPQSGPVYKILPGIFGLTYTLSPAQQSIILNKNIVCFIMRNGQVRVLDGVTTAGADSDYRRLTTVRIVNELIQGIRSIGEPFIGEPNDLPHRNALDAKIKALSKAMVSAGALAGASCVIKATNEQVINGNMEIQLDIVPASETLRISTTIALRPSIA